MAGPRKITTVVSYLASDHVLCPPKLERNPERLSALDTQGSGSSGRGRHFLKVAEQRAGGSSPPLGLGSEPRLQATMRPLNQVGNAYSELLLSPR